MDDMNLIPSEEAAFAEAKRTGHKYATKYPTKIRVASVQHAERAYKNAIDTSRKEELYAEYVNAIFTFADYISGLKSEATD